MLNTHVDAFSHVSDKSDNRICLKIKQKNDNLLEAKSSDDMLELLCDHIILASGASPSIDLAKNSGIEIDKVDIFRKVDNILISFLGSRWNSLR